MNEGRQAKGTFNVKAYKEYNTKTPVVDKDGNETKLVPLNKSPYNYGENLKLYYLHYIEHGKAEGRKALYDGDSEGSNSSSGTSGGPTQYGLIDYAPVYDFDYYITKYSDVRQAYGNDRDKVLQHFVRHGMSEGRSGNDKFNVQGYKNRYSDLRAAFGNDLKQYYLHYINYGIKENRSCELAKVTTYQGYDYALVYDFDYYTKKYSDLNAAFSNNPSGAIEHFIEHGLEEGRQAKENFSVTAYKGNYLDLRNAFGDNTIAYVRHYIECGYAEGRSKTTSVEYHDILGETSTTVNQMVTYFLANNPTYPSYYANNTDVDTISKFCKLYIDECSKYGVKAEVAFCQAMKETNFLKFSGDVKANQYNFAGLGATGGGVSGASFRSIQEGIRAQVQHLYAYANKDASLTKDECVDPRFEYVKKGYAPYVEWLGQKENPFGEGWATAEGYGKSIVSDYMYKLELCGK